MDAIYALRRTRTLVVVTHRLRTIMDADKVLVIQGGQVVEAGSPGDLLRQDGLFSRLHAAQSLSPPTAAHGASRESTLTASLRGVSWPFVRRYQEMSP